MIKDKNICELEKYIKITFDNIDLIKWEQKERKNGNEAFIYFSFHKSDDKLFYIGHVESPDRFTINDRIIKDSIKSGANKFKTKLAKDYMNNNSYDNEINAEILKNVDIYYIKIPKPSKNDGNSITDYKNQLKKLIKEKEIIKNCL